LSAFVPSYPAQPDTTRRGLRIKAVLTRIPMVSLTIVLFLISCRYLLHPVTQASAVGITLSSPDAVIVARVGFAGFPLAFAAIFATCLFSPRRILDGLRTELILLGTVIGVRILGMILTHSTATAKLLAPEFAIAALSIVGIQLEIARLRRDQPTG
jgi:hypothetical protein